MNFSAEFLLGQMLLLSELNYMTAYLNCVNFNIIHNITPIYLFILSDKIISSPLGFVLLVYSSYTKTVYNYNPFS